jgi:hypothetical protein
MSYASSSPRCRACSGTSARAPAPSVPTYDRCAGGCGGGRTTPSPGRAARGGCGCGGACSTPSRTAIATTKNYRAADCPTVAVSCETKQLLRDCAKNALCDFLRCASETLCPDGRFDLAQLQGNENLGRDLVNCVGQLACSFIHCVPEALCPPSCETTPVVDCLPCGYAVEVVS